MDEIKRISLEEAKDWVKWDNTGVTPWSKVTLKDCKAFTLETSEDGFETITYYLMKKENIDDLLPNWGHLDID